MKEIYYSYNNEAIASCIILKALQQVDSIDFARLCLFLPFLLDDTTVRYLKRQKMPAISIEEMVKQNSRMFMSFNRRFLNLLPVTINSMLMLSNMKQIEIFESGIKQVDSSLQIFDIGERFNSIDYVLPIFLDMTNSYPTTRLYQLLKVEL